MCAGKLFVNLAAPSVRRCVQVRRFFGQQFFALKQRRACYVGRR
jgi:hypothetical protein